MRGALASARPALGLLLALCSLASGETPCTGIPFDCNACQVCYCFGWTVDCSGRALTAVPASIPADTVELYLNENAISGIVAQDFVGLTQLRTLHLFANRISYLRPGAFSNLGQLRELDLSNNRLGTPPLDGGTFAGLGNLTTLNFETNSVVVVPPALFSPMPLLQRLELGSNIINGCGLPARAFEALGALRHLSLDNLPCGALSENEGAWQYHPRAAYGLVSSDVPCPFGLDQSVHFCGLSKQVRIYVNRALWRKYQDKTVCYRAPERWVDDSSWPMCNATLCERHKLDQASGRPLVIENKCACGGCPLPTCDAAAASKYSTECAESYQALKESQVRANKMAAAAAAARR